MQRSVTLSRSTCHPITCRCTKCTRPGPYRERMAHGNYIALCCLSGGATGMVIAALMKLAGI